MQERILIACADSLNHAPVETRISNSLIRHTGERPHASRSSAPWARRGVTIKSDIAAGLSRARRTGSGLSTIHAGA